MTDDERPPGITEAQWQDHKKDDEKAVAGEMALAETHRQLPVSTDKVSDKIEDIIAMWEEFFDSVYGELYRTRAKTIADNYPEEKSVVIPFTDLDLGATEIASDLLFRRSMNVLLAGEEAIQRFIPATDEPQKIHLRLEGLPPDQRILIRQLRAEHLGRLVAVDGLVRRATEVRPKIIDATFRCLRCGTVIKEPQEEQAFREPLECYEDQGGCKRSASATKFILCGEASKYMDTQKIEIQEPPELLHGGADPQRISCWLEDDIAGFVAPGMRVTVNGILRSVQKGKPGQRSTLFDLFLDVVSIEMEHLAYEEMDLSPEDIEKIKAFARADSDPVARVIQSIAPSIAGMEQEKEALALQLFGGVSKTVPDGRRLRGDIHVLLVGDPSVAKSELLSYIREIAPRAVLATGKGSSAAGLTAAAVRDEFGEGRWVLEAGVLVLADKGMAIIDEADKMRPEDRGAMCEAMEQQRVVIAKAGINAVLMSRCSVLMAANPKFGRFDESKYLAEQIAMEPPLLSRFDIILAILDRPNPERDGVIADHMLAAHMVGGAHEAGESSIIPPDIAKPLTPELEPEFLRRYVAYAKRIIPILTPDAAAVLKAEYLSVRKSGGETGAVPATPRQLDGLERLAEASARVRLSKRVDVQDAERAVKVMEYWMRRMAGEEGRLDIDIIATGISHAQREQMILLRDIIRDVAGQDDASIADIEDIRVLAQQKGISAEQVDRVLKRWKDEGEVYSPSEGKYRIVTRL